MEVVGVKSLEDALDLIEKRGEEGEVEVRVRGCMLRDVPALREKLRDMIREKYWGVTNLSLLRPFVPVAEDVDLAAVILHELLLEPATNRCIVDAARARGQEIQGVGRRLAETKMTWARGLGRLLKVLAKVMLSGEKREVVLRKQIIGAHNRCMIVSKRFVSSIPMPPRGM